MRLLSLKAPCVTSTSRWPPTDGDCHAVGFADHDDFPDDGFAAARRELAGSEVWDGALDPRLWRCCGLRFRDDAAYATVSGVSVGSDQRRPGQWVFLDFMTTSLSVTSQQFGFPAAIKRCALLTGVAAALWCLLAGPAWFLADGAGLLGLTLAAALCTIPGLLVFLIVALSPSAGSQAAMVSLSGTGLRLVFVLVGVSVVRSIRPDLRMREFIVWVLIYYLAMLASETMMVVRRPSTEK